MLSDDLYATIDKNYYDYGYDEKSSAGKYTEIYKEKIKQMNKSINTSKNSLQNKVSQNHSYNR